jgi:hypothetical protein
MATPIDYVDAQWDVWSRTNDASRFEHIDTELLKETLIQKFDICIQNGCA